MEQGLGNTESEELSWCPSCPNNLRQGWSAGLFPRNLMLNSLIIVTLTLTLWPFNSGALTSSLLPHLSSSVTDSLPFLNPLCHSKTDARFLQDAPKAVWSIPYVSVAFFPSLKQNLLHILLLKCPHIQIAFLKLTSFDNQVLVGCIPIAIVAVHLNQKS